MEMHKLMHTDLLSLHNNLEHKLSILRKYKKSTIIHRNYKHSLNLNKILVHNPHKLKDHCLNKHGNLDNREHNFQQLQLYIQIYKMCRELSYQKHKEDSFVSSCFHKFHLLSLSIQNYKFNKELYSLKNMLSNLSLYYKLGMFH